MEEKILDVSDFGFNEVYLFPDQPSILKSQNIDDIPFYFNNDYYLKEPICSLSIR